MSLQSRPIMHDVCDGRYILTDPMFRNNPKVLQIILNTDDLEIVNPLGSHIKKHKITIFYYTVPNIRPEYRSRLSTIQLLLIAKSQDLPVKTSDTVGILLNDFIQTVNKMAEGGIELIIHGAKQIIEGRLIMVCPDTLAAHLFGKLKEGFFCRKILQNL